MTDAVETMAWTGAVPWHGLGKEGDPDAPPEKWLEDAGLDWTVSKRRIVCDGIVAPNDENRPFSKVLGVPGKKALVRDSDNKVFDIVGDNWEPVQNRRAFEFFTAFTEAGGAKMETAGSLRGGRMVWGLANLGNDYHSEDGEHIRGYLLLASPHEAGKALMAKVTAVRVVCANTLAMANAEFSKYERRFSHIRAFNPADAVEALGVARNVVADYARAAEKLRSFKMSEKEVIAFLAPLYTPSLERREEIEKIGEYAFGPSLKSVMDSYYRAPGATPGSAWGVLNAITHHADHKAGSDTDRDARLTSAWFGSEAKRKQSAFDLLVELAS
jgi:phage/plasmid-like protein (TIGR03299 family)